MERTYTKYIPQTYKGIVCAVANETQAPRFFVFSFCLFSFYIYFPIGKF